MNAKMSKFFLLLVTIMISLSLVLSACSLDLSGAGGTKPDLSGDLRYKNLSGQNLASVDLSGRDLTGANLTSATLNRATITNAIFNGVNGTSTIFTSTKASGASFVGAVLESADFSKADLTGANFSGANLTNAKLTGAILTNVTYTDATIWPAGFNPVSAGAKMAAQPTAVPTATALATAENTYVERVSLAHCSWKYTVKTWVDENANQLIDENETPLAGVQVYLDNREPTITNQFGITVFEGGGLCGGGPDEISIKPPPGYKRTTSERIEIDKHSWKEPFLFGFIKE